MRVIYPPHETKCPLASRIDLHPGPPKVPNPFGPLSRTLQPIFVIGGFDPKHVSTVAVVRSATNCVIFIFFILFRVFSLSGFLF